MLELTHFKVKVVLNDTHSDSIFSGHNIRWVLEPYNSEYVMYNSNYTVQYDIIVMYLSIVLYLAYYIPYTGKFSRSQIFMNRSKIRCKPYLICVYKFCKNAKFAKLKLCENFPVYSSTLVAL